ncbi:MAG: ECF transporter S component [Clostridiaceae bacterium]|nr:ECF transporter S component [Clostridiaceae bacterium]
MRGEFIMIQNQKKFINTAVITRIAILSAVATVLMALKMPLWFAPSFYKIDLSEVAVLIGAFALGPAAGVVIEFLKVLLNFLIDGTVTAGVGELANFIMGCSFILPAAVIYKYKKSMFNAIIGMVVGIVSLTVVSSLLNYYLLLPLYAKAFNMPIENLVGLGTKINPSVTDLRSFILIMVVPFNLLKGLLSSAVTFLLYKRISPILHV